MRFFTPSFLLLSCFVLGGMIFKATAPTHCGLILPDDSIFVLTGDERRIPFAIKKMEKYPNTNLYIIGAGTHSMDTIKDRALIESDSKSTYQNALAIKNIVRQENLDRIVIITTEEHMNRAKYLIKHELPQTEIVTCPAMLVGMPAGKRLERWAVEYIKYIVTMFGIKES